MLKVQRYFPFLVMVFTGACGGGGGESQQALERSTQNPLVGSWSGVEAASQCKRSITFRDDSTFTALSLQHQMSGYYAVAAGTGSDRQKVELRVTDDNGEADCDGNNFDLNGVTIEYEITIRGGYLQFYRVGKADLLWQLTADSDSDVSSNGSSGEIEGIAYNEGRQSPDFIPQMFVLFKNGDMCTDLNIAITDLSLIEHKQAYPDAWGRWKWLDGRLVYSAAGGWQPFDYNLITPPFPPGATLNNAYRHTAYSSNGAGGAGLANTFTFGANGRFVYGYSFHASTSGSLLGDGAVAGIGDDVQGTYVIDGLRLTLNYDNGSVQKLSIIPNNIDDVEHIYLNGLIYLRH